MSGNQTIGDMMFTLEKFVCSKRKEVQEFCVTCRAGGFHAGGCKDCDLYFLALGEDGALANYLDESAEESIKEACDNCDKIDKPTLRLNHLIDRLDGLGTKLDRLETQVMNMREKAQTPSLQQMENEVVGMKETVVDIRTTIVDIKDN